MDRGGKGFKEDVDDGVRVGHLRVELVSDRQPVSFQQRGVSSQLQDSQVGEEVVVLAGDLRAEVLLHPRQVVRVITVWY